MFIRILSIHLLLPLCKKNYFFIKERENYVCYYSKKDYGSDMRNIFSEEKENFVQNHYLKKEMDILTSKHVSIIKKISQIQENKDTYKPIQLHLEWK